MRARPGHLVYSVRLAKGLVSRSPNLSTSGRMVMRFVERLGHLRRDQGRCLSKLGPVGLPSRWREGRTGRRLTFPSRLWLRSSQVTPVHDMTNLFLATYQRTGGTYIGESGTIQPRSAGSQIA